MDDSRLHRVLLRLPDILIGRILSTAAFSLHNHNTFVMAIPREEWAVLNRPPTWLSNHPAIQARGIELDMGAPLKPVSG